MPALPRRARLLAACLAAACVAAAPASAALYKWTDAQGRVVYSDQPPPGNQRSEQLRGPPPPANPNAAKELAQREADYRKQQSDAAEAAAKAAKARENAGQIAENCTQVRNQLRQLSETQIAIYRYNEKGEREVMDEDARGRERAKLNTWLRDNKCPAA
jgi:hypothetical protein